MCPYAAAGAGIKSITVNSDHVKTVLPVASRKPIIDSPTLPLSKNLTFDFVL